MFPLKTTKSMRVSSRSHPPRKSSSEKFICLICGRVAETIARQTELAGSRVDLRRAPRHSATRQTSGARLHHYRSTRKCNAVRGIQRNQPSPHRGESRKCVSAVYVSAPGSNCAISAVCGALPLKVSTLPSAEMITRSPSTTSPARIISASGSCTWRWITRFNGRAP